MDSQHEGCGFTEASGSRRCLGPGWGWTGEQRRMLQGRVLLLLPAEQVLPVCPVSNLDTRQPPRGGTPQPICFIRSAVKSADSPELWAFLPGDRGGSFGKGRGIFVQTP